MTAARSSTTRLVAWVMVLSGTGARAEWCYTKVGLNLVNSYEGEREGERALRNLWTLLSLSLSRLSPRAGARPGRIYTALYSLKLSNHYLYQDRYILCLYYEVYTFD